MLYLIIIIVGGLFLGAIISAFRSEEDKKRNEEMTQAIQAVPDFTPVRKIVGTRNLFTFAVDNERNKILYAFGSNVKTFNFEDIISVEKMEDGAIISQKSTTRTLGGAIVGGALAGGVGAVIGGLSGGSTQKNLHSSVKVKILLRNNPIPSIEINCFDCKTMTVEGKPVKDGSTEEYIYKTGLNQANQIVDILSVIIDAVDRSNSKPTQTENSNSVAEEIAKLAILKEKGILTEEEFSAQKAKLLGTGTAEMTTSEEKPKILLPEYDPIEMQIRDLVASGQKLAAIKLYKDTYGTDLAAAKDFVDSIS